MVQAPEDLGLEAEPLAHLGRHGPRGQQLHGRSHTRTFGMLGEMHHAHAAVPELAHEPPQADRAMGGRSEAGECLGTVERRIEHRVLLAVQQEELQHLALQRLIPGACLGEEARAPAARHVERGEEQLLHEQVVGAPSHLFRGIRHQ